MKLITAFMLGQLVTLSFSSAATSIGSFTFVQVVILWSKKYYMQQGSYPMQIINSTEILQDYLLPLFIFIVSGFLASALNSDLFSGRILGCSFTKENNTRNSIRTLSFESLLIQLSGIYVLIIAGGLAVLFDDELILRKLTITIQLIIQLGSVILAWFPIRWIVAPKGKFKRIIYPKRDDFPLRRRSYENEDDDDDEDEVTDEFHKPMRPFALSLVFIFFTVAVSRGFCEYQRVIPTITLPFFRTITNVDQTIEETLLADTVLDAETVCYFGIHIILMTVFFLSTAFLLPCIRRRLYGHPN